MDRIPTGKRLRPALASLTTQAQLQKSYSAFIFAIVWPLRQRLKQPTALICISPASSERFWVALAALIPDARIAQ